MPPFLPRKRVNPSPPDTPQSVTPPAKKAKHDTDRRDRSTLQANREFTLGSDESDSPLSDVDSDEFEDVPQPGNATSNKSQENQDEDEDIDWEDAVGDATPVADTAPEPSGDLQITLKKNIDDDDADAYGSLKAALGAKKGPSKIERQIRIQTHTMHVQFLMFHNAIRNNWIGNHEVQQILVKQLSASIQEEIQRWRVASGLAPAPAPEPEKTPKSKKEKSKKRKRESAKAKERNERDWGETSQRLEEGKPDLSRPDPLISLLRLLCAYWKQKFKITAPGLRKNGYRPKAQLRKHIVSFHNDEHDPAKHGEIVRDLDHFKELAKSCQGSRDVGAQLFTALLRGIGIEARMVANLQPIGFGWTKVEEATAKFGEAQPKYDTASDDDQLEQDDVSTPKSIKAAATKSSVSKTARGKRASTGRGREASPIDLDTDNDSIMEIKDDESVVDVTPKAAQAMGRRFDRDLPFPIYWTEAISPITNKPLPVSPFIGANAIATNEEMLTAFEPRGAKADKGKQIMAYVLAFSPDGSAKDVTTRYLKKHMWPGKTKGFRVPVEKVPVYNKKGKVLRYGAFDWFKTLMSGYTRRDNMRTAVDDLEETTDLVPKQLEKKNNQQEGDTLQSLRASAEFALERFLRREEALKPGAKPVRTFTSGKGDNVKEENVYLRSDVLRCLSAEAWHKEGRRPKAGEITLKQVPVRAVTTIRKREIEEQERVTGEKATQGLYSKEQTEYIIPPPIKDGIIPKNAYGNIDCFVPSMVPKGAIHIPFRGTVRICKKLEIDYAEAVTGFEFGNRMAVPVIQGVVVAIENEHAVIDAWEEYDAQQRAKEEAKQQKGILAMWRRMIMGLRIKERVQEEYGDVLEPAEDREDFIDLTGEDKAPIPEELDNDTASLGGGGFMMSDEDEPAEQKVELEVDHNDEFTTRRRLGAITSYPTPTSATSNAKAIPEEEKEPSAASSPLSETDSIEEESEESQPKPTPARTRGRPKKTQEKKKPMEKTTKKAKSANQNNVRRSGRMRATVQNYEEGDPGEADEDEENNDDSDDASTSPYF